MWCGHALAISLLARFSWLAHRLASAPASRRTTNEHARDSLIDASADLQVSLNSFCDLYKAVDCSPRQPERRNKTRVDGERTSDRRVADALALYQG